MAIPEVLWSAFWEEGLLSEFESSWDKKNLRFHKILENYQKTCLKFAHTKTETAFTCEYLYHDIKKVTAHTYQVTDQEGKQRWKHLQRSKTRNLLSSSAADDAFRDALRTLLTKNVDGDGVDGLPTYRAGFRFLR